MKKQSLYAFLEQYAPLHAPHVTERDLALLTHIDSIAPKDETQRAHFYTEFLNGAYVFIPDNGNSYDVFSKIEQSNMINRDYSSSHHSMDTQYAFRSQVLGECLFGTRELDSQKGTWIQLEAYHTSLPHLPAHLYTYAVYMVTGENSGPLGNSSFTEKKPYILTTAVESLFDLETDLIQMCLAEPNVEPIFFDDVISQANIENVQPAFLVQDPLLMQMTLEMVKQEVFSAECI